MNVQSELTRLSIELYKGDEPRKTAAEMSGLLAYSTEMPECDRRYYWEIIRARLPHFQLVSDN